RAHARRGRACASGQRRLELDAARPAAGEEVGEQGDLAEAGAEVDQRVAGLDGGVQDGLGSDGDAGRVVADEARAGRRRRRARLDPEVGLGGGVALARRQAGEPGEEGVATHQASVTIAICDATRARDLAWDTRFTEAAMRTLVLLSLLSACASTTVIDS